MDSITCSADATTDHLYLKGLVLGALESGRLAMSACDYRDISSAATCELSLMDAVDLMRIGTRLPPALHALIENILFEREASGLEALMPPDPRDARTWPALMRRMRRAT